MDRMKNIAEGLVRLVLQEDALSSSSNSNSNNNKFQVISLIISICKDNNNMSELLLSIAETSLASCEREILRAVSERSERPCGRLERWISLNGYSHQYPLL